MVYFAAGISGLTAIVGAWVVAELVGDPELCREEGPDRLRQLVLLSAHPGHICVPWRIVVRTLDHGASECRIVYNALTESL